MSHVSSVPVDLNQHGVPDTLRPVANYRPSIWEDIFLHYDSESLEVNNNVKQQAQILKEEVKKMFQSSINQNIIEKLQFIDSIQRFGVSYHFQPEINQALENIYINLTKNNTVSQEGDLHTRALLFRMLRQQGCQISSDVFNKFKNEQGNFNETLANDIQGLCSLYEAAHLRTHKGDDILEEAHDFTKQIKKKHDFTNTQLESLTNQLSSFVAAQINHCLRQPFNKSVPRFEARYHMTIYEQDSFHNKILLTFAKVDFNILQKMHQKEISSITKWWRRSNFVTKVPHARVRLVESYLWSLAVSYQPQYSKGRMLLAKTIVVLTLVDDTYDAYGTIQELELFTKAIERWDISLIKTLPHCMKAVFDIVVELCEEVELETTESGNSSFAASYFKQAVIKAVKGYMVEAKWCHEGYIPTYEEYKVNGIITACLPAMLTSLIGPGESASEDVFKWIFNDPNINIEVVSLIGRLVGDLGSHKFERERVHIASSVECCMKQYGISEAEAYNLIHNDVEDCWKVINEECLKSNDIPKFVLDCLVNFARSFELIYGGCQDKFTNGELLHDYVSSLLMDPMCIDQHE